MPYEPATADVHIDAALTNFSVAYTQDPNVFVADKVFPILPVAKKTDKYWIFDKASFLKANGEKTPYGTEAPRGGWKVSTDSYSCDVYRWATDVTPDVRANADPSVNVDQSSAEYVMQCLLLKREVMWTNTFFKTGVWATDKTGGAHFGQWDDVATSDPITDIAANKTYVLSQTGLEPNTLVVSQYVHDALKKHPLVLDRFKHTSSDSITEAMLARLFEVQRYVVCKAIQASGDEGLSPTFGFVQGKHALLAYVPSAPGIMRPASGLTYVWSGLTGLNNLGIRTFRIPLNHLGMGTERIEGEYAFDMRVVGSDLGVFFANAVA